MIIDLIYYIRCTKYILRLFDINKHPPTFCSNRCLFTAPSRGSLYQSGQRVWRSRAQGQLFKSLPVFHTPHNYRRRRYHQNKCERVALLRSLSVRVRVAAVSELKIWKGLCGVKSTPGMTSRVNRVRWCESCLDTTKRSGDKSSFL